MTSRIDWAFRADFLAEQADQLDQQADRIASEMRKRADHYRELSQRARVKSLEPAEDHEGAFTP
jgi:hypothetical protein